MGLCSFSPQVNNYHTPLAIRGSRVHWHSPITLDQLLSLKSAKDSRIVVGNTEIGSSVIR